MALVTALALLTSAGAADLDPFLPASSLPGTTGTLQAEAPQLGTDGISAGLYGAFAQNLMVVEFQDGRRESVLASATPVTLHGGYTYNERFRVDAFVPIYAHVDVRDRSASGEFGGVALGDLRLQGTVPLYENGDAFHVAVVPRLFLPTGSGRALVRNGIGGTVLGAIGGEFDKIGLGYVANLGLALAPGNQVAGVGVGSSFDTLLGGYWRASDQFRIGAETELQLSLARGENGTNHLNTVHAFAQSNLSNGLGMTVGAGTGLFGLGAPEYRLFAAMSWSNLVRDADKDGISDDEDHCVDVAEDFDAFEDWDGCPEPDNDLDGVTDLLDQCPLDPEDLDGFADADGCPDPDNDGDSVPDTDDQCPDQAGLATMNGCPDSDADGLADPEDSCPEQAGPKETKGCPDSDGDLVPDFRDACPDEPRPETEDPAISDGCPKTVFVEGAKIRFDERIQFENNSDQIKKVSHDLLDRIFGVLSENSWIILVEIGGHTDNVGSELSNLKLSDRRATAVMKYLVDKGIDAKRLRAKGYGETDPRDTNRTAGGRAANRRVEFKILDQNAPPVEVPLDAVPTSTATPPTDELPPPSDTVTPAPTEPSASPWGPQANTGTLTVKIVGGLFADAYIDDEKLSRVAPFSDLTLDIGRYELWLTNLKQNLDYRTFVTIEAGEETQVMITEEMFTAEEEDNPWGLPQ